MQLAPFKIKDERHPQSSRAVLIYVNLGRVTIQIQVQVYTIRLTRPATGLESAKFLGVFSRPIFVIWTFFSEFYPHKPGPKFQNLFRHPD